MSYRFVLVAPKITLQRVTRRSQLTTDCRIGLTGVSPKCNLNRMRRAGRRTFLAPGFCGKQVPLIY